MISLSCKVGNLLLGTLRACDRSAPCRIFYNRELAGANLYIEPQITHANTSPDSTFVLPLGSFTLHPFTFFVIDKGIKNNAKLISYGKAPPFWVAARSVNLKSIFS